MMIKSMEVKMMDLISNHKKQEILDYFKEYQLVHLATIENEKPRVRPVTLSLWDGKFWVITGADNAKIKQIQQNPNIEFCYLLKKGASYGYIRVSGHSKITDDQEIKESFIHHYDYPIRFWEQNPEYTLLEFVPEEISYFKPEETSAQSYKWE